MSQAYLHDALLELFESKNSAQLNNLFQHADFEVFITKHELPLPLNQAVVAFIHASFSHEFQVANQEIAEFLGDAVLQLIISAELLKQFPDEKEGKLSKLRSYLVNEKSLATLALGLGLDRLILVGKGEFSKKLYTQEVVLADTLEALIGQLYRHAGYEQTEKIVLGWFHAHLPESFNLSALTEFDAKSKLQEATLAKYKKLPRYSAEAEGTNFKVQLWVNEKLMAEGLYSSKKNGEKELAQKVLKENLF